MISSQQVLNSMFPNISCSIHLCKKNLHRLRIAKKKFSRFSQNNEKCIKVSCCTDSFMYDLINDANGAELYFTTFNSLPPPPLEILKIVCRLLIFFKINFFEKFLQEYHLSVWVQSECITYKQTSSHMI